MKPSVPKSIARAAAATLRRAATRIDGPGPAQVIELDYPVDPVPRWGHGEPSHAELAALMDAGRARFEERLRSLLPLVDELAAIPFDPSGTGPGWVNGWFQGLDAASLYGFLVERDPATYFEIGGGHSTRFARHAVDRHQLRTRIVSVDPDPRSPTDDQAHESIVARLEDLDLGRLSALGPGDVLLFDGSHRSFTNSDVTVFFCEILPRLPSGLLVYVDDIFLPWDYPPQLSGQWWSEQYLLASWLLAGDRLEVTLPNFWISTQPELHRILAPLWDRFTWAAVPTNGTGFWLTVR